VTPLGDVDLGDSFVLDLRQEPSAVVVVVEAALGRTHPLFYWPPRPGEQHAYARASVNIAGDITWLAGPFPARSSDASGERDYGDASGWSVSGSTHKLTGEWGSVTIEAAVVTVEWQDPTSG
jgi:hypothetical protein